MINFTKLLTNHNFKVIHEVNDGEGIFRIYSNGVYSLHYYFDDEEDETKIYPLLSEGGYVLEIKSKFIEEDFSEWNDFFNK